MSDILEMFTWFLWPCNCTDRSESDRFKQRGSPIWRINKWNLGWHSSRCQLSSGLHIQSGEGGIKDSFIYLLSQKKKKCQFQSLSCWNSWYFQQDCSPVKVKATPRKPFDYNGKLSHNFRVDKVPMTHATLSLAGELWDRFHLLTKIYCSLCQFTDSLLTEVVSSILAEDNNL